jgi:hypothetical protein
LMQWAFVLLLVFFLLYFSPLFFSNNPWERKSSIEIPDLGISPQKSIIIPLILTYIGIYVLAFTVTRDLGTNFNLHLYILLLIFLIFGGYMFTFDWDTIFFRDALRFHLICSYITIFAQLVYFFVFSGEITSIHLLFSIVTVGFSYLFFTYFRDESMSMFLAFVLSAIISIDTGIVFLFGDLHIFTLLWLTGCITIILFEYAPRFPIFQQFIEPSRILFLTLLLGFSGVLIFSPLFSYFHFVYFLPIFAVFLFSIHIRYSNYISYSIAIIVLFFLYSYFFSSLLFLPDILSALLFIFFFSLCIIGNTYFWEERYPYDFSLLHYSSIGFSVITAAYSLFFVAWWAWLTLFLACSLFLLAALFLLSYFRFQYR